MKGLGSRSSEARGKVAVTAEAWDMDVGGRDMDDLLVRGAHQGPRRLGSSRFLDCGYKSVYRAGRKMCAPFSSAHCNVYQTGITVAAVSL